MRLLHAPPPLADHAGLAAGAGLIAAVLLIVGGFWEPRAAFAGWLIGYLLWSGVAVGGLVLVLIRTLTGGRWGAVIAATLAPAAGSVPFFCLLFIPIAFGAAHLFSWARDPGVTSPSVAALYLNAPSFLVRAAIALVGWSVLAVALVWMRPRRTGLLAGLGLAFHGLAISIVAVDWVLSVDPRFVSTDFGADLAITQLLLALAWAALFQPYGASGRQETDLGQLLQATLLGVFYLFYMEFLVHWYGDLPEKASWWLRRSEHGWRWLLIAGFLLSGFLPFAALLSRHVRRDAVWLRWIGLSVLLGVFLRIVWLVAPEFGPWALLAALLGVVAVGGLWIGVTYGPVQARLLDRHAEGPRGVHA